MQAGYVRGGRSRRIRPVLQPGNLVQAEFRARSEDQLAQASMELVKSRAAALQEPLPAAAIEWVCALTTAMLPEGQEYPHLYQALDGLLTAVDVAPAASGWAAGLVRYELLILSQMGFGLDLSECAATGARANLRYVSPKSGRAVSAEGAGEYIDRLMPLPSFLVAGGSAEWTEILQGLRITGHFLERDLVTERYRTLMSARERLLDRLKRIATAA